MTGPEHYAKAQSLLRAAVSAPPGVAAMYVAQAQVHAILALVAKLGATDVDGYYGNTEQARAWMEVLR